LAHHLLYISLKIKFVPSDNHQRMCLVVENDGKIIGGLYGVTYWNWLYIELLWVDEKERRKGLGTNILKKAEKIAIQRGCKRAQLETHDFQNPEFYLRHNYRILCELADLPEGHTRYYLYKQLIQ